MIYFKCGDWEPLVTEEEEVAPDENETTPTEPEDEGGIPVTDPTTDPTEAEEQPSDGT